MVEKYKLQYWDHRNNLLSINWAHSRDYVAGDCRVRAIPGDMNVDDHNRIQFQRQTYSAPMTLEEAREYIAQNSEMLGKVHDCVGLTLEDVCIVADFTKPIEVRNIGER